jgi:hypothetical protein
MKLVDRLLALVLLLVVAAAILPAAIPPLTTITVIATVCFVALRLVIYYTQRW